MSVDIQTVKRVARLARIAVTDEDAERMSGELNTILGFVEQLNEVDVSGVEPMTSVIPMEMKKRRDEVTDGNNDERSIDHATLKTVFTATGDGFEPNDGFGTASPLPTGTVAAAAILPKGDADWFEVEAPRAGEFAVLVDQVDEDLDIYVRLWNADGKAASWVGPPRPGGVTDAVFAVEAAGTYRLEVRDGNNDARSPVRYRLGVDFR